MLIVGNDVSRSPAVLNTLLPVTKMGLGFSDNNIFNKTEHNKMDMDAKWNSTEYTFITGVFLFLSHFVRLASIFAKCANMRSFFLLKFNIDINIPRIEKHSRQKIDMPKTFAHSNKSQKLPFSITFALLTFSCELFCNFFKGSKSASNSACLIPILNLCNFFSKLILALFATLKAKIARYG